MGVTVQMLRIFGICMLLMGTVQAQERIAHLPGPLEAIGTAVAPELLQPPRLSRLKVPQQLPAGQPQLIARTAPTTEPGPGLSEKFPISEIRVPGQDGMAPPLKRSLLQVPFLAGKPERIAAGRPQKKKSGPFSVLTYDQTNGLKDDVIGRIYQDKRHHLWGTTAYGGVFRFDGKFFRWITEAQGLANNTSGLLFTSDEEIWFGTINGITQYDGKYMNTYTQSHGLVSNWALGMDEDKYGNIWTGSVNVVQMLDRSNDSIYVFGREQGLLRDCGLIKADHLGNLWIGFGERDLAVVVPEKKADGYHFQFKYFFQDIGTIRYISKHPSGNMWLGTSTGIYEVSEIEEGYENMQLTRYEKGVEEVAAQIITGIDFEQEDRIWISTRGGVYRFEPASDSSSPSLHAFTATKDIPEAPVNCVFIDHRQNVWMGSGGLSLIRNSPFHLFDQIKNPSCIAEDLQQRMWIGSKAGLYLYDPKHPDTLALYTTKAGIPAGTYSDLAIDSQGRIWISIQGFGLSIFDPEGGSFTHYGFETGIPSQIPTQFFKDPGGDIWLAFYTPAKDTKGGIARIKGTEMTFIGVEQGLIGEDVMAMDCDTSGRFWIGSWGMGINCYEPDLYGGKGKVIQYSSKGIPIENRVRTVMADRNGDVWTGGYGGGGVTRFLAPGLGERDQIRHYSLVQGMSSASLLSALQDTDGNIWLGTNYGLHLLPTDQLHQPTFATPIVPYTEADGFPASSCTRNVLVQSSDGLIWVGGDDRLIYFDPKDLMQEPARPTVLLKDISLFNQAIPWKKDTSFLLANGETIRDLAFDSLSYFDHLPQDLSLSHHNNFIDFDYAGTSIDEAHKLRYQTKLVGLEKDWSTVTADSRISYNGLRHGRYRFQVRARIANGPWGVPLEYAFEIRTPWWLTWWAYSLYVSLLVGLLFVVYRFQLNRRLEKAEALRLLELDAAKTRLYTNITHEFRTPLTVISGMASQLKEYPKEWLGEGLSMIEQNAFRLLALVNQMLDLGKLESGKMALQLQQREVIAYLKYLFESVHSLAESKQIQLQFHAEEEKLIMDIDPEKIQQVVINLLSNAVKFTPEGGQVYMKVRQVSRDSPLGFFPPKPLLELEVRDTGVGIPKDQLPFIFDRFYQGDNSSTRKEEGSGIGLALVKELIQLMEGEIFVESQPGKGTAFRLILPISTKEPPSLEAEKAYPIQLPVWIPQAVEQALQVPNAGKSPNTKPGKPVVLIIEDNPDIVAYMASFLHPQYDIQVGKDGQEGIEIAFESIPDLIVSDVMMPVKNGFEVCNTLKKK